MDLASLTEDLSGAREDALLIVTLLNGSMRLHAKEAIKLANKVGDIAHSGGLVMKTSSDRARLREHAIQGYRMIEGLSIASTNLAQLNETGDPEVDANFHTFIWEQLGTSESLAMLDSAMEALREIEGMIPKDAANTARFVRKKETT